MSLITQKLGDVCSIKRGTTITQKLSIDGDIPVVAGGLKPTYYHNAANRFGKTITVSGSGANAGFVNYWSQPIFASDCSTVEVNNSSLDIIYIYYFLLSKQEFIYKKLRSGAAQPHVYGKDIASLDILIPPLKVQQQIVAKLDAIFAEIDKATAAAEANAKNAEALFQSQLEAVFSDGNCEMVRLSSITADITDGDHQPPPKALTGVPFITISNVNKTTREIDFSDTFKVSRDYFDRLKPNRKPKIGDVLYTVTGSYGIPIHIDTAIEFCFQRHIGLIRPLEKIDSKWLYWLMLTPQVFRQAIETSTGTAQQTVSLKALRNFEVPNMPIKKQHEVVNNINMFYRESNLLREGYLRKSKAFRALKNSILQQAFNGELVKD